MAINIKRIEAYLMSEKSHNILHRPARYLRICISTPIWYSLSDGGSIYDKPDYQSKLEQLYKESNGFLEQLELF